MVVVVMGRGSVRFAAVVVVVVVVVVEVQGRRDVGHLAVAVWLGFEGEALGFEGCDDCAAGLLWDEDKV